MSASKPPSIPRLSLPAPSTRAPIHHHQIHTIVTLTSTITSLRHHLSSLPANSSEAPSFQQELSWSLEARHAVVLQLHAKLQATHIATTGIEGPDAPDKEASSEQVLQFCIDVVDHDTRAVMKKRLRLAERGGWTVKEMDENEARRVALETLRGRLDKLRKQEAEKSGMA